MEITRRYGLCNRSLQLISSFLLLKLKMIHTCNFLNSEPFRLVPWHIHSNRIIVEVSLTVTLIMEHVQLWVSGSFVKLRPFFQSYFHSILSSEVYFPSSAIVRFNIACFRNSSFTKEYQKKVNNESIN